MNELSGVTKVGPAKLNTDPSPQLAANLDSNSNDVEVTAGNKVVFDGVGGNTYLTYNSTTNKLEVWVDGVKKMQWG